MPDASVTIKCSPADLRDVREALIEWKEESDKALKGMPGGRAKTDLSRQIFNVGRFLDEI